MLSKIWILNLILGALIIGSWIGIWSVRHSQRSVIPETLDAPDADIAGVTRRSVEQKLAESSTYEVIVEKNLFSPDRTAKIGQPLVQEVPEEPKISGEKIMLYGVVILNDYKAALINNLDNDQTSKPYRWIREGEKISNLTVAQIQKEKILLQDGSSQYTISLYRPNKEKGNKSDPILRQEPQIVNIGKPQVGSPLPESSHPVSNTMETEKKNMGSGKSTEPQKTPPPFEEKKKISADGQYEIIDTPFGTMKRKINK